MTPAPIEGIGLLSQASDLRRPCDLRPRTASGLLRCCVRTRMASGMDQRGVKAKEKVQVFRRSGLENRDMEGQEKGAGLPKCCLSGAAVLISQCARVSQRLINHDAPLIGGHRLTSDCAAIYKTHFLQRFGKLTLFSAEVPCGLMRSIEIFALHAMIS